MQNAVLKEKLAKARALAHSPALPGRVEAETLNNWRVSAGLMESRGRILVVSVRHHVPEGHPLREAMERVRAGHETLLALLAGMGAEDAETRRHGDAETAAPAPMVGKAVRL